MKTAKMKKILAVLLAAMSAASLAACGGNETASSGASSSGGAAAPGAGEGTETAAEDFVCPDYDNLNFDGDYITCKETTTLEIGCYQDPLITDYDDNKMTNYLEDLLNIEIEWELYPAADALSKIRVMISSGTELPDILGMNGFSSIDVYEWGSEGAILPLDDYIENYSKYYKDIIDETPLYRKQLTMPDGHIYAFPNIIESLPNSYSQRAWINKKWLDTLGLDIPTTTDELEAVLKAFVTGDPNGNGKPDEIGLSGSTNGANTRAYDWIMNAFIYNGRPSVGDSQVRTNVSEDGKTLSTPFTTDEWREGLSYMNRLCEEGLYDPVAFTQDNNGYISVLNTEEGSLLGVPIGMGLSINTDEAADYVPMNPISGPDGVSWANYFPTTATAHMLMTDSCDTPGAAFALCDALLSYDVSVRARFGEPGVDCILNEDGTQVSMLEGYDAVLQPLVDWAAQTNVWWHGSYPTYAPEELIVGHAWDGDVGNTQYQVTQAVPYYRGKEPEYVTGTLIFTSEEADAISDSTTTIIDYVNESIARFITGDLDIDDDSAWQNYLDELQAMGLSDLLSVYQAAYDRMNAE